MNSRFYFVTCLLLLLLAAPQPDLLAQISFSNVTAPAGIDTRGETWGAAWGDANNDGWPDVFLTNHWRETIERTNYPEFYLNNQDGTFQKWSPTIFDTDNHGACWADVDNDGKQDLLISTGRGGPNQLFLNRGDTSFLDIAGLAKIQDDGGRGRTPVWADLNNDGNLDMVITYNKPFSPDQPYTQFYVRTPGKFLSANTLGAITINKASNMGIVGDLDADLEPELLLVLSKSEIRSYEYQNFPSISEELVINTNDVSDLVLADFNGDLRNDIFVVRNDAFSNAVIWNDTAMGAHLLANGDEVGVRFRATDTFELHFTFNLNFPYPKHFGLDSVPIDTNFYTFAPGSLGPVEPHIPGVDTGIYIGYNAIGDSWEILFTTPTASKGISVELRSKSIIFPLGTIGFSPNPIPYADEMYFMTDDGFVDTTSHTNIYPNTGSISAVAGDFDNDMDLDLFMACSAGYPNLQNALYENQGDGTFAIVPGAGGANGTFEGLSESVTMVDYDRDGYLDIFVTNGNRDIYAGPCELFNNSGSGNHFISIKLEGIESNRDGVGSIVHCYAGGKVQLRENANGLHKYSQNESRLHFGLGSNTQVDSLVVYWPSGFRQVKYLLEADQYLTISEFEPCAPPVVLQTTLVGLDDVLFKWSPVIPAVSYRMKYGYADTPGFIADVNTSSLSAVLTGLNNGTEYKWKIRSNCEDENSSFSGLRYVTIPLVKQSAEIDLSIYPNPVSDLLVIKGLQGDEELVFAEVVATDGRSVLRKNYTGDPIVVSALASGMYILRLINSNDQVIFEELFDKQ